MPHVIWRILTARCPKKSWRMVVTLVAGRYLMDHLRYRELQYLSGRAVVVYARWVFLRGLPSTIDKLPENGAYLLWVGPKRLDKVLLTTSSCFGYESVVKSGWIMVSSKPREDFFIPCLISAPASGMSLGVSSTCQKLWRQYVLSFSGAVLF